MKDKVNLLDELSLMLKVVQEKTDRYDSAAATEKQARSLCTDALNELNAAQRKVDGLMNKIKGWVPAASDWARSGKT